VELPVLIEAVAGSRYVARVGPPFDWSAEGATPDEALGKLREEAANRVATGTRVATLAMPPAPDPLADLRAKGAIIAPSPGSNPWLAIAGMWKDDPTIDEFRQAIEEYRREIDNDPTR
jgi:hypothetical protein